MTIFFHIFSTAQSEDNIKEENVAEDQNLSEAIPETTELEKDDDNSSDSDDTPRFPDTQIKIQHFDGTK